MRIVGLAMLALGLAGLGTSLWISGSRGTVKLRESRGALRREEEAAKRIEEEFSDLLSRRGMVALGLERAVALRLQDDVQHAKSVMDRLDAELLESAARLRHCRERLTAGVPELHSDVHQLRVMESFIACGFCSCALIPAALPLIIGSFLRVGRSLRPQSPLARHPFLALFAAALVLLGLLLLPIGIQHVPSGTPSDLTGLLRLCVSVLFLIGPPLASVLVGTLMLAALFRPWDVDEVG